jgi:hypothetical protein
VIVNVTISTPRGPVQVFSLLLLTQGYTLGGEFMDAVKAAWDAIQRTPPFTDLAKLDHAKQSVAVYADQFAPDLGLVQTGDRLEVDEAKKDNLRNYLATNKVRVRVPSGDFDQAASEIWPEDGRVGRLGSLVAVIVKGNKPGELYQLTSNPRYPVPLVAVVATGQYWTNVIVRGVAQTFGVLADEFELPGIDFKRAPHQLVEPRPNIVIITDEERTKLVGGAKPQDVVRIPFGWAISTTTPVSFHPHFGDEPDTRLQRASAGARLVEGGAGYRFGALRCDFDCLMRRTPNSSTLPIQAAGVEFCTACFSALREQVNSWQSNDFTRRPRILLDSQRPLCDTVGWNRAADLNDTPAFDIELGAQPSWSCHVEHGAQHGMRLSDVRLKNRPGDPFAAVEQIFKSIEFKDIKVKFAGMPERVLPFSEAFANTKAKPSMVVMRDGLSKGYLGALRLALTWHIPDAWTIEAVLSVVFKDKRNDFDPGGAAMGAKLYPQLALRYRRPPKGSKGSPPKVEWLAGSISFETSNALPANLPVHPDLHHFLTGKQEATLAVDSNSSDYDNQYDWDREDAGEFVGECLDEDVPEWGIWGADWKSGRKLASVADPPVSPDDDATARGWAGAIARRGHLTRGIPVLPHWSWLFDYVTPMTTGSKRFVATYRDGEKTPANLDGGRERSIKVKWPVEADQFVNPVFSAHDYEMTVYKMGRQGAYDSVHIHPSMGIHNNLPIVPAPFCAEICMHLHVRWGLVTPGALDRPQFLGWGRTGRLDDGAHSSPGAPLVPPNQHVEINLALGANSSVTYEARAHDPDFEAWQVFLEQGTGILFSYDGMRIDDLANLAGALHVVSPRSIRKLRTTLNQLRTTDAVGYDRFVRLMFHEIYDKIRWYNFTLDRIKPGVQQVPAATGAPANLEGL